MSIIANLARIPEAVYAHLLTQPEEITALLYPELAVQPASRPGFWQRLLGRQNEEVPVTAAAPLYVLPETDQIDLDKSWHLLHWLFCGSSEPAPLPAGFLMLGGRPVGDIDVGYGPASALNVIEVQAIADFLAPLHLSELQTRQATDVLPADLYPDPACWFQQDATADWAYLAEHLHTLQGFVAEAAACEQALLVYLN